MGYEDDFNLYAYVANDPLNATDPTGRCAGDREMCQEFVGGIAQGVAQALYDTFVANDSGPYPTGVGVLFGAEPGPIFGAPQSDLEASGRMTGAIGTAVAGAVAGARAGAGSGLGDLTRAEARQIQGVVNRAGRPLEVVGSAARGERRAVGSDLPIGKVPGTTRSDTDFTTAGANRDNFNGLEGGLPNANPTTPILRGTADPALGPSIRFEPNAQPRCVPGTPPC